ncbi:MAG: MBL fold metallo-hydrolase [Blastocatellia bacterium]|nr:MBL fold metallo-hydrolase [Blastocatellia bacterium]
MILSHLGFLLAAVCLTGPTPDSSLSGFQTQEKTPPAVSSTPAPTAKTEQPLGGFDVQKVAEGVYAVIRTDPPGLMFDANCVFIINDDDVVVVDSSISPASTRDVLAALRKLTPKPVKYVINTHWHEDHIIGNQVYKEAFPGVEFIAQATTREDFPTVGLSNRKQLLDAINEINENLRDILAKNKNSRGGPLTDEQRLSLSNDVRLLERYQAEAPKFQVILPTITFDEKLTLQRGRRTIEVQFLGRAHTRADVVVSLPADGIVITGDLVVWPVPLVGSTAYPLDFGATLEKLLALHPKIMIPGHGPVMQDDRYVKLLADLLKSLKQQVTAAVARGETLEQVRKSVKLEEFQQQIVGDSAVRKSIFQMYFMGPAIDGAFRQALEKEKK